MLKLKSSIASSLLFVMAANLTPFAWADSQSEKAEADAQATVLSESFEATTAELANLVSYNIDCGGGQIDLANPLAEITTAIEDSVFLYGTKPLTDCSGIFHRVLKRIKQRCPKYAYPSIKAHRDTRDLARWYHEQGKLILIQDVMAHSDLIKPGAVLFYGQRGTEYKDFTAQDLFKPGTGINHVGVVVKVHKDDANNIARYELFHGHGRAGETPASTTRYHRRKTTNVAYPAYGNGTEQWVAFATLVDIKPSGKGQIQK